MNSARPHPAVWIIFGYFPSRLHISMSKWTCFRSVGTVARLDVKSAGWEVRRPWRRREIVETSATAFAVAPGVWLTAAHAVAEQVRLRLWWEGVSKEVEARVMEVGDDCDLAVVKTEEVEGVRLWRMGGLPRVGERVKVVGYDPEMVETRGMVKEIAPYRYLHAGTDLLGMRVGAQVTNGVSGGPVFDNKGNCVGVAFQNCENGDGVAVPIPIAQHFLHEALQRRKVKGFCCLGLMAQPLDSSRSGILINGVIPATPADVSGITLGDILLEIDGYRISNQGTVNTDELENVRFDYVAMKKFAGDVVLLTILRSGKRMEIPVKLFLVADLIPQHHIARPDYFVFGGLVFTVLSKQYLVETFGESWMSDAPSGLVRIATRNEAAQKPGDQIVILSAILCVPGNRSLNSRYAGLEHMVIRKVNGRSLSNLRELVGIVELSTEKNLRFVTDDGHLLVIDRDMASKNNQAILEKYEIFRDRSLR